MPVDPMQRHASFLGMAILVGLTTSFVLPAGCVQKPNSRAEGTLVETLKSPHGELQSALQALAASGDTPDKIASEIQLQLAGHASFLQELTKVFEYIDVEPLGQRANRLFGNAKLQLSTIDIEAIHQLRMTYAPQQEKLAVLLESNPPLGLLPHQAYANDFDFLRVFDAAHALLLLTALEEIAAQSTAPTLKPLSAAFKLCRKLEEFPVATTRAHAANLRRRTLRVLAKLVAGPSPRRETWQAVSDLLQQNYAQWVAYKDIVRGERAMGLMVYEQIRSGEFLSLISQDEYLKLKEEKLLEVTRRNVRRNIDGDEVFFLTCQQQLLDWSEEPYFKRIPKLQALRDQMTQLAATPEQPYIACKLLLHDMEQVQIALAQDRALFEAWIYALQSAVAGQVPATQAINPLDGAPFQLTQDAGHWIVRGIISPEGEERIEIAALKE